MAKNQISNYTTTGKASPAFGRSGIPVTQIGHFDTETGHLFPHPRLRVDGGVGSSSHVRITNPKASAHARASKTASLGMGGVGQRGRNND